MLNLKSLIALATVGVVTICFLATAPVSSASPGQIDSPAHQDLTPMESECSPKALKKYCAYRSKCKAVEKPGSWLCKKGDQFVVRISKRPKFALKSCRATRAKIRRVCEPRD